MTVRECLEKCTVPYKTYSLVSPATSSELLEAIETFYSSLVELFLGFHRDFQKKRRAHEKDKLLYGNTMTDAKLAAFETSKTNYENVFKFLTSLSELIFKDMPELPVSSRSLHRRILILSSPLSLPNISPSLSS